MAETFGVKLKSKDTPKDGTQLRPGCKRTEFKTKPVSDLKAMFDKSKGENTSKAFSEVDNNVTSTTTSKTVQKTEPGKKVQTTVKTEVHHEKVKKTNSKGSEISAQDKKDFEALAVKLKKTGVDLNMLEGKTESKVAVAKTYSGGKTYQATVGSKVKRLSDKEEDSELNRNNAASVISFGLTKLMTRPGNLSKQDSVHSRGNSFDEDNSTGDKAPSSPKSISPRSNSPVSKESRFIPGAAKGWKSKPSDSSSNTKLKPTFSDSSVGKLRSEKDGQDSDNKIPGFRSVSPVFQRKNSSDDSSTNSSTSNLSPRGYRQPENKTSTSTSAIKTDENKNFRKMEDSKQAKREVFKQNAAKTKKDGDKEGISERKKLFENKSDTGKVDSKSSPKGRGRGDFKWIDKKRMSLEDFKQTQADNVVGHRPLSRASSSGSNSSLSRKDVHSTGIMSKAMRFDSPEPQSDSSHSSRDLSKEKRHEFAASRKMSAEKFLDIKQNFETKGKFVKTKSQSPSAEQRKKLDIKPNKQILERKQSFEGGEIFKKKTYEKSEVISPRDRGNVLATIKSLNELDARAKAEPTIIRRTQSLPSDSLEDENDSSVDYYEDIEGNHGAYYQDILGIKMGDDASNEGDISSEADLLYEEIPANLTFQNKDNMGKKDFQNRRATAFRKRKKTNEDQLKTEQASTEDSDTDSSHSGIYEPIDHNDRDQFSESDSIDLPPELPPLRNQNQQKKKKKKEEKSTKGLTEKFKQLYKGKNKEGESKGNSSTSANTNSQSTGVLSGLGDKLKKNLKKSKNNSQPNLEVLVTLEDNPVCESDSDTDMEQDKDSVSKRSSLERSDEVSLDNQGLDAPPLPPRHSALHKVPSGPEMSRLSIGSDANSNTYYQSQPSGSPRTPPRSPRPSMSNTEGRTSPPLPPRSRVSGNIDLSMVIPIAPGGSSSYSNTEIRKSGKPVVRDSYLHGQKMVNQPTSPEIPYIDESPQTSPSPDVPPLPTKRQVSSRTDSTGSYVDVDGKPPPPVPTRPGQKKPLAGTDSYVDVDDHPIDSYYSLADEIRKGPVSGRKELEKRPVSSAYIKPYDLSTVPEPKRLAAPFEDVLKFRSENEDGLYIDLSDEQVYGTIGGTRYKSKLESEDLYQFYNTEKITRASKRKAIYSSFDESDEESFDGDEDDRVYEDLSEYSSGRGSLEMDKKIEGDRAKKISTLEMFGKKGTVLRTLWADMPEVKSSGYLDTISPHERKLQEAMFEIITSEATYLKSLNVLIDVFLMSEEFGQDMSNKSVLTRQERHVVFSNIGTIRDISEKFLADLESQWQKSVMLDGICDIITKHASNYFECYVHYCSNQSFQDKHITELKKKMEFAEALRRLESHTDCQGLPMISFLLLPMQRITRLPLLVDAICHRLDPINDKVRHKSAINAFNAMSKVVKKCNDGAKKMQQTEQMCLIAKEIGFPTTKEIPSIPLISASRYLVKQGEVTRIMNESSSRIPFGKARPGKQNVHLFLFNDILLITKKKGSQYIVTDYTQRNSVDVNVIDDPEKNTRVLPMGVPGGCKYLFLLVILENYEKKQVEAVFSCSSTSDRARWVDAFTPVKVTDDQRIYEEWDCPQVQCIKKYVATEPDELGLEESDVVNVFKKLEDGMYEGERIRDGERGWFPKEHTLEIVNSHVRARNLRMKYRIMAATEGYGS